MGQYYKTVVQATKIEKNESGSYGLVKKQFVFEPHGAKLTSCVSEKGNFPLFIEELLYRLQKEEWNTQLVLVGDYAQNNFGCSGSLYEELSGCETEYTIDKDNIVHIDGVEPFKIPKKHHKYIINCEKQEYVNLEEYNGNLSALLLLTADGNGKGGGDYFSLQDWRKVGSWKYDTILVKDEEINKEEDTNISYHFMNDWLELKINFDD